MKSTSLILTAPLKKLVADAKANGCVAEWKSDTGTVTVRDGETTVLRAIQKGKGQPWIAIFTDSDRITWAAAK